MSFGGSVKLTGESEYRAALKKITQNLKEVSAEMKLVASQYDKNDKSEQAVEARTKALASKYSELQKKLSLMATEYRKLSSEYTDQTKKHDELVKSYDKEKDELERIGRELGETSDEYKAQEKVVDSLGKEVEDSAKSQKASEDAMSKLRLEMTKAKTDINNTAKEIDSLGDAADDTGKETKELGDSVEDAGEKADSSAKGGWTFFKGVLADLVSNVIQKAASAVKDLAKEMVNAGMGFEQQMSNVGAISGASADEMQRLADKAKEMGAKSVFSASQSAEAFSYMAMAGWKTEDMLDGIEGIMNLAAASGADLATTSDIVTDALTAMGYAAGDAGRLADVMAAASSNANTNVEMMGGSFKYVAPLVGAMGFSMEDTAVAIGELANNGIKAEKAGTALRAILSRLSAPPKEASDAMEALNLTITNSDGTMKSLDQIMKDLTTSFDGLSEAEQAQYAKHIAGQEAMSALLAIVNTAPEDYAKLRKAVDESAGSAQKMADTMNDNVGGAMTLLKSQIEGIEIDVYNKLAPAFRTIIDKISKRLAKVDWGSFGDKLAKGFDVAIDILSGLFNAVSKVFGFIKDNWKAVSSALAAIAAGFVAFKVASLISAVVSSLHGFITAINGAQSAMALFNSTAALNPFGLILTAVGAVVGGVALYVATAEDANQRLANAFKESHQAMYDLMDSGEEMAQSFRDTRDAAAEQTDAQIANVEYVEKNLLPQLRDLVDANGDVKAGEEARAQYILGELNSALGTEYEDLSAIVGANGEIKQSIYDVINARKAQILLEGYESTWKDAIDKVTQAETERAQAAQLVVDATAEKEAAEKEYKDLVERDEQFYQGVYQADTLAKKAEVEALEDNVEAQKALYDTKDKNVKMYYDAIDRYEAASLAMQEGNTQKTIDLLSVYSKGLKTATSVMEKSAEEQKEILGQQVIDTQIQLKLLTDEYSKSQGKMTDEEKRQAQTRIDQAKKEAVAAKEEFKKVGGNLITGTVEGIDGSKYKLNSQMQSVVDGAVNAARGSAASMYGIGKYMADGLSNGYSEAVASFYNVIDTSSNYVKHKMEQIWGISSPSKWMRRIGEYLVQGEILGIEDEQKDLEKTLNNLGVDSQKSLVSGLGAQSAMKSAQKDTDMVSAFKEALSEMKIELDDRVAGKFIERTVARAIY